MPAEVLAIGFGAPADRDRILAAAGQRFRIRFVPRAAAVTVQAGGSLPHLCVINGNREAGEDTAVLVQRWTAFAPEVRQIVVVYPRLGAARAARAATRLQRAIYCVASPEGIAAVMAAELADRPAETLHERT